MVPAACAPPAWGLILPVPDDAPRTISPHRLAKAFASLLQERRADGFDAWITAAPDSALRGFADGLMRDEAAVRAALTEPWSTSPVEGQIKRLKGLKRQMYGRAKHDLLRSRVMAAA